MYDRITAGAVGGLVAGVLMGFISMILNLVGICDLCVINIGFSIFSTGQFGESTIFEILFGWIIHLVLSVTFGVLIAIMLTYFGTKFHILKGATLIALLFIVNMGIIGPMLGTIPGEAGIFDFYLMLFYHIIFGGLSSYIIVRYGNLKVVK